MDNHILFVTFYLAASHIASSLASSIWHCWPPVDNDMSPVSQSWAMCCNDGECWWEECGPDQSIDYLVQIRLVTMSHNPFSLGSPIAKNDGPIDLIQSSAMTGMKVRL